MGKIKDIHHQDLEKIWWKYETWFLSITNKKNTLIYNIYKKTTIHERHRHRYEFNFNYLTFIKKSGVVLSGMSPNRKLVEIMERKDHPWFLEFNFTRN